MAQDHFDDVDHLMKALRLEGVNYRDFSGRTSQPKLKLIGGRSEVPTAPPPRAEAKAQPPRQAPSLPEPPRAATTIVPPAVTPPSAPPERVEVEVEAAAPSGAGAAPAPAESLQATFSRLIARAPQPPMRKLKLDLHLRPRSAVEAADANGAGDTRLSTLFGRLSQPDTPGKHQKSG